MYRFSCGKWLDETVPESYSGTFASVRDLKDDRLRGIKNSS